MIENKQRWFGHVIKRNNSVTVRVVMEMNVEAKS